MERQRVNLSKRTAASRNSRIALHAMKNILTATSALLNMTKESVQMSG
jgi:hypothetical protein